MSRIADRLLLAVHAGCAVGLVLTLAHWLWGMA